MKSNKCHKRIMASARMPGVQVGIACLALMTVLCLSARGDQQYKRINLVSDLPGVALLQDTNLVNAWGMAFSSASPFWVSDNGTGKSTLYAVTNDVAGRPHVRKVSLEVNIPGEGNPTGMVFNDRGGFNGDVFLFASEDGTISGWRGPLGTNAEILAVRSGAVYKGLTLATKAGAPVLLAANFSEGTVDVYGTNAALMGQFSDPSAPAGYAPFNVQSIEGMVFVTFAKQDEEKEDDVPGPGHGLIDVFNPDTGTFHRFVTGSDAGGTLKAIDSPWGIALAPATFGEHRGQLLVGNFGSGTVMTFDPSGRFHGLIVGGDGNTLRIQGLWALAFGNGRSAGVQGTLYFTAGPGGESHGLFGSIEPDREDQQ